MNLLEKFPYKSEPKRQSILPRQVSSGYLKELTYVLLCNSLLRVVDELGKGEISDEGIYPIKLAYKDRKRLNRRIQALRDEMTIFCATNGDVIHRVHSKNNELFVYLMDEIRDRDVDLTTLSMYILLLRFQEHERDKPLHIDFRWLSGKDSQILSIIDIIKSSPDAQKIEPLMYSIADKVARSL